MIRMLRMMIRIKLSIFSLIIIFCVKLLLLLLLSSFTCTYTMSLTTGPYCNKFLAHLPQPEQKEKKRKEKNQIHARAYLGSRQAGRQAGRLC